MMPTAQFYHCSAPIRNTLSPEVGELRRRQGGNKGEDLHTRAPPDQAQVLAFDALMITASPE